MLDLCCFGFLSAVSVLRVLRYPSPEAGSEILDLFEAVGADAPIVALLAARFGLRTGLVCNPVGTDVTGHFLEGRLGRGGISTNMRCSTASRTPQTFIVADEAPTRTWFSFLPGVAQSLREADLSLMDGSRLVYLDCYHLIRAASLRFLERARELGLPVFVNLDGEALHEDVAAALRSKPITVLQTSFDPAATDDPTEAIQRLAERTGAELTILTLGSEGCLSLKDGQTTAWPAFPVEVSHTHGAGAAFSAGIALGLLKNWPIDEVVPFACAAGSLFCTVRDGYDVLTEEAVKQSIGDYSARLARERGFPHSGGNVAE